MAGDLSVGERCLPAGGAAGAEKIPASQDHFNMFDVMIISFLAISGIINTECK